MHKRTILHTESVPEPSQCASGCCEVSSSLILVDRFPNGSPQVQVSDSSDDYCTSRQRVASMEQFLEKLRREVHGES